MIPADIKITPMLEQYFYWKEKYPDCLLLFRMGDFYELFFDDAKTASKVLDIVVTSRDPQKKIPMAGVPHHALNNYTSKLVRSGYNLAICDQISEPDGKNIVDRKVTRILTPGTYLSEDDNEDAKLAGIKYIGPDCVALALLSVGTGELKAGRLTENMAVSLVISFSPGEILYPRDDKNTSYFIDTNLSDIESVEREIDEFEGKTATRRLKQLLKVSSLEGFGITDNTEECGCASVLCNYVEETQFTSADHIRGIIPLHSKGELFLDRTTQFNLELINGSTSLYSILDQCRTSMGKRKLKQWILHPLLDTSELAMRQEAVEFFYNEISTLEGLRKSLSACSDLERTVARLSLGNGSPRDLSAIRDTLSEIPQCLTFINKAPLKSWFSSISPMEDLFGFLKGALVDEVPRVLHQSPLIRKGFDEQLDHWRSLSDDANSWLREYLQREKERTGLNRLKAGYNKVYGYYLEVTRADVSNIPEEYIRKQTLVGSERFITPELKDFEEKIVRSEEEIKKLERSLWEKLVGEVLAYSEILQKTGSALAEIDILSSFGKIALSGNYCRPVFSEGNRINIIGGRHPVIERMTFDVPFVPNDVELSEESERIAILTGPNMAGKSTYLRMAALIVIMAQVGSFVPAESCIMSPVDRIFTRIGARDDLARGNSTFMLEMLETANILHNVTGSSLVILDEIGRGTSTYDGMSIAWSVIEYLHEHCGSRPKVLFATHYHELTKLAEDLSSVVNLSMDVEESRKGIRFLHQIVKKPSDRSYGVEVAKLAGIPSIVVRRSEELVRQFEDPENASWGKINNSLNVSNEGQLNMFSYAKQGIIEEIANIDPDSITPLEALELIYRLRAKSRDVIDN